MFTRETYASFIAWIKIKISLHRKQRSPFFKEGELWWCSIGMNVGQEIFGKGARFARPVLVFKKITHHLFLGIPLTTVNKKGGWYVEVACEGRKRIAILSQARVLDGARLHERIGMISDDALGQVTRAFGDFYSPGL